MDAGNIALGISELQALVEVEVEVVAAYRLARELVDLKGEGDETCSCDDIEEMVSLVANVVEVEDLALRRRNLSPVVHDVHDVSKVCFGSDSAEYPR
jgi:hypothetical protein